MKQKIILNKRPVIEIYKINDFYTVLNRAYINADVVMDGEKRNAIIVLPINELSALELKLIEGI